MKISIAGIELIQHFEDCRLDAYLDAVGIPTIGWGTTGPDIKIGMKWTQAEADARFRVDLNQFERAVEKMVTKPLKLEQFSALVSLAYNIGVTALRSSTLLRKLNNHENASDEFLRWQLGGGKVLIGLAKRRMAERLMFLNRDWRVVL